MKKHSLTKSNSSKNHHIVWDEDSIRKQHENKGNYQKINEPKTPYNERIEIEEQKEVAGKLVPEDIELQKHLHEAEQNAHRNHHNKPDLKKLNQQLLKSLSAAESQSKEYKEEERTPEEQQRHAEFVKKRVEHYSEIKKIREMGKHLEEQ